MKGWLDKYQTGGIVSPTVLPELSVIEPSQGNMSLPLQFEGFDTSQQQMPERMSKLRQTPEQIAAYRARLAENIENMKYVHKNTVSPWKKNVKKSNTVGSVSGGGLSTVGAASNSACSGLGQSGGFGQGSCSISYEDGGYLGTTNEGFDYNGAWGGTMQMGGMLPGASSFMYAREGAPSNGKYAKKTMASAQRGRKMYKESRDIDASENKQWLQDWYSHPATKERMGADSTLVPEIIERLESVPVKRGRHLFQPASGYYNPSRHIIKVNPDITDPEELDMLYNHELTHSTGYVPRELPDVFTNHRPLTVNEDVYKEKKELLKNWDQGYYTHPPENYARIMGVRKFLQKKPGEKITPEELKGTKYLELNELRKIYKNDEKIAEVLNSIAAAPSKTKQMEDGGSLEYYQEGRDFQPRMIGQNGLKISEEEKFDRFLRLNEDERDKPYKDRNSKEAKWTIAVGHELTEEELKSKKVHGISYKNKLTKEEIDTILKNDIDIHRKKLDKKLKEKYNISLEDLSPTKQYALLDMEFNLGSADAKFPKFTEAIVKGDYNTQLKEYKRHMKKDGIYVPLKKRNETFLQEYVLPSASEDIINERLKSGQLKFVPDEESIQQRAREVVRERMKKGGEIKTDNDGYWNPENWGRPVRINSNNITMKGVPMPLLGISDTGDVQYMSPGRNYQFEGNSVTELPIAYYGINLQDEKTAQHLDDLTNFTNYNKAANGWQQKYSQYER